MNLLNNNCSFPLNIKSHTQLGQDKISKINNNLKIVQNFEEVRA